MGNPTLDVLKRKRERLLDEMADMEPGKALDEARRELAAIEKAIESIGEFETEIRRGMWT